MGYHGSHETRSDLLGFASSQEILELGAGGRYFHCRDYDADAGSQRVHQLRIEWSRNVAQGRRLSKGRHALDSRLFPATEAIKERLLAAGRGVVIFVLAGHDAKGRPEFGVERL